MDVSSASVPFLEIRFAASCHLPATQLVRTAPWSQHRAARVCRLLVRHAAKHFSHGRPDVQNGWVTSNAPSRHVNLERSTAVPRRFSPRSTADLHHCSVSRGCWFFYCHRFCVPFCDEILEGSPDKTATRSAGPVLHGVLGAIRCPFRRAPLLPCTS